MTDQILNHFKWLSGFSLFLWEEKTISTLRTKCNAHGGSILLMVYKRIENDVYTEKLFVAAKIWIL
jgi:hypothetical protein